MLPLLREYVLRLHGEDPAKYMENTNCPCIQSAVLLWTALQRNQSLFTPYTPIAAVADFLLNVCAILFAITVYASAPLRLSVLLVTPAVLLLAAHQSKASPSRKSTVTTKPKSKLPKLPARSEEASQQQLQDGVVSDRLLLPVRPFLTHYRGSMLVVTCLAILAVDFPIFPRRFAKVETWGTSLMDLGVGSFVFSAGVVSARALVKGRPQATSSKSLDRQHPARAPNKNTSTASNSNSSTAPATTTSNTTINTSRTTTFITHLLQAIRHSMPLLFLGFIRLWSVKGLDYAEHVTEYGVHWNFFFTLGLLPPFVGVCDTITRKLFGQYRHDTLAITLALVYEVLLDNTNLLRYIIAAPRGPDLLSMNREGVFSFTGYLAIFLAGRGTGMRVVRWRGDEVTNAKGIKDASTTISDNAKDTTNAGNSRDTGKHTTSTTTSNATTSKGNLKDTPTHSLSHLDLTRLERRLILRDLLIQSITYATLYFVATDYHFFNLSVSRRLANLPYVLWVAGFNNFQIFVFGLIEAVGPQFTYNDDADADADADADTEDEANNVDTDNKRLRKAKRGALKHKQSQTSILDACTSPILRAFNTNGLVTFLAANLLTGLVNLTVNTLDMPTPTAMAVLLGYAAAVTGVAVGLDRMGVQVRV